MVHDRPLPALIVDYGEVVSLPQPVADRAAMEAAAGVDPAGFWAAYWAERSGYDRGRSGGEYWRRVADRCGARWSAAQVQQLWSADVASWLRPDPEVVDLLGALAARGVRLGLLSNAPHGIAGALRASPLLAPFTAAVFSCDIGACKPEPAAYTRALEAVGAGPGGALFVDDRAENVQAAEVAGLTALHYTGPAGLRAFAAEHLGPEPREASAAR